MTACGLRNRANGPINHPWIIDLPVSKNECFHSKTSEISSLVQISRDIAMSLGLTRPTASSAVITRSSAGINSLEKTGAMRMQ